MIKPSYFLIGSRCPFCGDVCGRGQKALAEYVLSASDGEYCLTDRKSVAYKIQNIATGEIKYMARLHIIQELSRPTQSRLLPLTRREHLIGGDIPLAAPDDLSQGIKPKRK